MGKQACEPGGVVLQPWEVTQMRDMLTTINAGSTDDATPEQYAAATSAAMMLAGYLGAALESDRSGGR